MVTGAWAMIAVPAGVRSTSFWGLAYLTVLVDATILYFCL